MTFCEMPVRQQNARQLCMTNVAGTLGWILPPSSMFMTAICGDCGWPFAHLPSLPFAHLAWPAQNFLALGVPTNLAKSTYTWLTVNSAENATQTKLLAKERVAHSFRGQKVLGRRRILRLQTEFSGRLGVFNLWNKWKFLQPFYGSLFIITTGQKHQPNVLYLYYFYIYIYFFSLWCF